MDGGVWLDAYRSCCRALIDLTAWTVDCLDDVTPAEARAPKPALSRPHCYELDAAGGPGCHRHRGELVSVRLVTGGSTEAGAGVVVTPRTPRVACCT